MNEFLASVISPQGKIFSGDVVSCMAPGEDGMFGVMARHAHLLAQLKPGVLTLKQTDKTQYIALDSGVLEVGLDGAVVVLTDNAQPCLDAGEAKAKSDQWTEIT